MPLTPEQIRTLRTVVCENTSFLDQRQSENHVSGPEWKMQLTEELADLLGGNDEDLVLAVSSDVHHYRQIFKLMGILLAKSILDEIDEVKDDG